jgi:Cpl-7 lysozyme-like protein/N-acetylmuramoyl-L-alanine amidase-like protein
MVAAYDKVVKNLIGGLNATGHVTHEQHRKDMVTFHHNGGRLSHEGVLNVWKTRPASAHFDVDAAGNVAQYVEMNEYAWACGNTEGNQRSISIEMCNEATNGQWPVSETTWRSAARLAGWLFAKVIGTRPSSANLVPHHHWKATTCAGPYMDGKHSEFVSVAQQAFDFFKGGGSSAPPSAPPSSGGKSMAQIVDEVIAGQWGNNPERSNKLRAAGYDPAAVQSEVNRKLGGGGSAPAPAGKTVAQLAQEVLNGEWGNGEDRKARLQSKGYNYDAVQAEVNRRLGGGAPAAHRPSVTEIARAVIRGEWGNNPQRRQRLEGAGYNYAAVQAEVNRLL